MDQGPINPTVLFWIFFLFSFYGLTTPPGPIRSIFLIPWQAESETSRRPSVLEKAGWTPPGT
jgi:hypothetical protein